MNWRMRAPPGYFSENVELRLSYSPPILISWAPAKIEAVSLPSSRLYFSLTKYVGPPLTICERPPRYWKLESVSENGDWLSFFSAWCAYCLLYTSDAADE